MACNTFASKDKEDEEKKDEEKEDEEKKWRFRDRTKLFEEEITIAGRVTDQQFKLFLGDVVRVSAEMTNFSFSAYKFFQAAMSKFQTDTFDLHKKLKEQGFVLQRIVHYRETTYLIFDVNTKSLEKLQETIKDGSLGYLLLSSMKGETGKKDGKKFEGLRLKLNEDDVNTAKNNLSHTEEQIEKLQDIYRGRTLTMMKRTGSDAELEDNNPTKKKQTNHDKENATRIKMMGENSLSLENRPLSRPILGNLANKQ